MLDYPSVWLGFYPRYAKSRLGELMPQSVPLSVMEAAAGMAIAPDESGDESAARGLVIREEHDAPSLSPRFSSGEVQIWHSNSLTLARRRQPEAFARRRWTIAPTGSLGSWHKRRDPGM